MNRGPELRERLKNEFLIGGHVFLTDPSITEALATYGYDFIWIDTEHGPFDKQQTLQHIMAANGAGAAVFVRVISATVEAIKPVLEMGVDAIILPMIKSAAEAEAALSHCLYPPQGTRGFGPRRAIGYNSVPLDEYLRASTDSFLRIIQIEDIGAVEEIDAIVALEGVDALVIGPQDLASSMGLIGQSLDPRVLAAGERVIQAAKKAGIPVGSSIGPNKETIDVWLEMGVDYIAAGDDISFLYQGAQRTFAMIKE